MKSTPATLPQFANEITPREIKQLAATPKLLGALAVAIAGQRQHPIEYIFTKLVDRLRDRSRAEAANTLKAVALGNTIEHFKGYVGADDVNVREFGIVVEKISQHAKRFCKTPIEAASPRQRAAGALHRYLLIPKMQIDNAVVRAAERTVAEFDIFSQPAELHPEDAIGRIAEFKYARLPLYAAVDGKNEFCPKRARDCGESPGDARH